MNDPIRNVESSYVNNQEDWTWSAIQPVNSQTNITPGIDIFFILSAKTTNVKRWCIRQVKEQAGLEGNPLRKFWNFTLLYIGLS